jgi:site-specific recombinase XerD
MVTNDKSERTQRNNLKSLLNFVKWLDKKSLNEVKNEQIILNFLNTKRKSADIDPDQKWITTYNDYVIRLKHFLRWKYNKGKREEDWITPEFAKLKKKKVKRISSYSESEIWDKEELLSIIKYEPNIRNKAILTLLWDMDARNHELVKLKIKNLKIKENYAEGEIPFDTKTGSRYILLRSSFPYVCAMLNKHPYKAEPEAYLIYNDKTRKALDPDTINWIFKELKKRIRKNIDDGIINEPNEIEKMEYLLKTKKWNPYCIRHSAITDDADNIPDNALTKKVGWSMNTKQRARYTKMKIGKDLRNKILARDGIILDKSDMPKPSVIICWKCSHINGFDYQVCEHCNYPLHQNALDKIKEDEEKRFRELEEKHSKEIQLIRQEIEDKFQEIFSKIDLGKLT